MAKKFNLSTEVRGAIRHLFRRSPTHRAALTRSRIEKQVFNLDGSLSKRKAVFFECQNCKDHVKIQDVNVDHITPVGPAPGSKNAPIGLTWDTFLAKVFCSLENLQILCVPCHKEKNKRDRKAKSV